MKNIKEGSLSIPRIQLESKGWEVYVVREKNLVKKE